MWTQLISRQQQQLLTSNPINLINVISRPYTESWLDICYNLDRIELCNPRQIIQNKKNINESSCKHRLIAVTTFNCFSICELIAFNFVSNDISSNQHFNRFNIYPKQWFWEAHGNIKLQSFIKTFNRKIGFGQRSAEKYISKINFSHKKQLDFVCWPDFGLIVRNQLTQNNEPYIMDAIKVCSRAIHTSTFENVKRLWLRFGRRRALFALKLVMTHQQYKENKLDRN